MKTEEMIPATEFCIHHNIELSFIDSLNNSGLIETNIVEETLYIPVNQLSHLEKLVRMYYEMDINLEGIETINHLLQQINAMQQQIVQLNNKLRVYENE
jgi:hypothetical protein